MLSKREIACIVITAVIASIIVLIIVAVLNKDNFSLDKVYLEDLQNELNEKEKTINEFENFKTTKIEERLDSIENYLVEIEVQIEDIYEQTVPESKRNNNTYEFTE